MATLKEFEDALRERGMVNALAILDDLKKRDRAKRSIAPARRVVGRKMTTELAHTILDMHATTGMTQQEIAFKLGVNQGRVNEVIKRGKWLSGDLAAPEALSRDKAMDRLAQRATSRRSERPTPAARPAPQAPTISPRSSAHTGRIAKPSPAAAPSPGVRKEVEVELPFRQPASSKPATAPAPPRSPALRAPDAPSPIVSAQLAFLDL